MDLLFITIIIFIVSLIVLWKYDQPDRPNQSNQSRLRKKVKPMSRHNNFHCNPDKYKTLTQVNQALEKAGLESCNVIVGIDFTKSNLSQGRNTWGDESLHFLSEKLNPYQQVIDVCRKTLDSLDDDKWIPAFGFGCTETLGKSCFSFTKDEPKGCMGFEEVGHCYKKEAKTRNLCGPTNFAPVIHKAVQIVKESGNKFHVLIIICDGQVTNKKETIDAIVNACQYPLAIIIVGVGDGDHNAIPGHEWDEMELYDDELPEREWDNVQFVPFNRLKGNDIKFAVAAMQELPDQFKTLKKMGMI